MKEIKSKIEQARTSGVDDIDIKTISTFDDVKINTDTPIHTRFMKFIEEVKNPYIFQSGNITVKMEYSNSELNLEKCLNKLIKNHMQ